jgi:membrane protease YdiL (CAAX protease family)
MTRKDRLLATVFLIAFVVLAAPVVTWFAVRALPWPSKNTFLHTAIITVLGNRQDLFSALRVLIAPIGVIIATQISKNANSKLTYFGLCFFILGILDMVAPLTMTPDFINGTVRNFEGDPKNWVDTANSTFRQYSESSFSTCAFLFGLRLRGST